MKYRVLVLFAVAAIVMVAAGTGNALIERHAISDLTVLADDVIIGTVDNQYSAYVDQDMIHTFSDIFVENSFFGTAPQNRVITVETLGGEINGEGLWVEDQPDIKVGEEVILFLNHDKQIDTWKVTNHVQGKYTLENDWVLEYDVHITDFVAMMLGEMDEVMSGSGVRPLACVVGDLGIAWPGSKAAMWWNKNGTSDCSGEATAARKGGQTWNNVSSCPFYFYVGGQNYGTGPTYDGKNQLFFKNGSGFIGVTYIWYSGSTYRECDLQFNDSYAWSASSTCPSNKMDVQNIATHELGHCWGADDEYGYECSEATMYGYANYGETKKRTLTSYDMDAIRRVY